MNRNARKPIHADGSGRSSITNPNGPYLRFQRTSEAYDDQPTTNRESSVEKTRSCLKPGTNGKTISFSDTKKTRTTKKNVEEDLSEERKECPCCRSAMQKIECLSKQLSEMQAILDERFEQQEENEIKIFDMLHELLTAKRNPGGTDSLLVLDDFCDYKPDLVAIENRGRLDRRSRNRERESRNAQESRHDLQTANDSSLLVGRRDVSYPTRLVQYNIDARGSPVRIPSGTFISAEDFLSGVRSMGKDNGEELRPRLLPYNGDSRRSKRSS